MPTNKASRLAADIHELVDDLKQQASQTLKARGNSRYPYERGEALGASAALAYSAERLESLLAHYMLIGELSD
jgi:hypothetical protein